MPFSLPLLHPPGKMCYPTSVLQHKEGLSFSVRTPEYNVCLHISFPHLTGLLATENSTYSFSSSLIIKVECLHIACTGKYFTYVNSVFITTPQEISVFQPRNEESKWWWTYAPGPIGQKIEEFRLEPKLA